MDGLILLQRGISVILHLVWRNSPGKFFCISTKDRKSVWQDHFFKRSEFVKIQDFLNANADKDLYWCPHGFSKPRRLKKYAEIPNLLWADLDESDPRKLGDLMPTVAWESSPGRFAAVWVIDQLMTEELNRRLTYHIHADHGGWDLTQVLRIPNTINHKYASKPKTKLLWMDGPTHQVDTIVRQLPQERKKSDHFSATSIYKKYEKNFGAFVRRQLINGKPVPGKRSEVFWKLSNELIEAGCSRDEAFELLRVSPWNKFAKRRDGDEQLRRELDKALSQHLRVEHDEDKTKEPYGTGFEEISEEDEDHEQYKFLARSMAEVEEENLDWLWYPFLARGELTILEGDPGLGKSYLAQMVAKSIVDGEELPSPKHRKISASKVAYFDIENASGTVTKKRLKANGCKNFFNFFQEEEPFSMDQDETLESVYEAIEKLRPALIVFDTLNTYMGGADTHNASETQQIFRRFVEIARRFKCAVLVLRHLTKSNKGDKAIYRGQGSIAFSGLARVVMTVGSMPNDPELRVMAITKINVAKPPKAITFRIIGLPDTIVEQDRSIFKWGDWVDLTSDQILNSKSEAKANVTGVIDWLKDMLNEGPILIRNIYRAAESRSIPKSEVERAAAELGLIVGGLEKSPTWELADS